MAHAAASTRSPNPHGAVPTAIVRPRVPIVGSVVVRPPGDHLASLGSRARPGVLAVLPQASTLLGGHVLRGAGVLRRTAPPKPGPAFPGGRCDAKAPVSRPARALHRSAPLYLHKQPKDIDVVSHLTSLRSLTLREITLPDLSLLLPLTGLRALDLKLGGTHDLS